MLAHAAARGAVRLWRAPAAAVRFAHGPRGKGLRAPPSDSLPRQAELAGFLLRALRARVRFAQVFFVLAHAAARPCARSRRSLGSQHGVIGSVRAVAARLGDIDPLC